MSADQRVLFDLEVEHQATALPRLESGVYRSHCRCGNFDATGSSADDVAGAQRRHVEGQR